MSRILRCLVCLILVCCILINCSPLRAEATMVETAAGYMVTVNVAPLVAASLIGLGVGAMSSSIGVFDSLVTSCVSHLQDLGLCQEFTIDVLGYDLNGISLFGLTPSIIDAIRSWLYSSETVTETVMVNTTGYSASAVTKVGYAPEGLSKRLYVSNSDNTLRLIKSCLNSDDFLCTAISTESIAGLFSYNGRLVNGCFPHDLGVVHSSLLGVYDSFNIGDLLAGYYYIFRTYESGSYVNYKVFTSTEAAQSYFGDSWLTSAYIVVDPNNITQVSNDVYATLTVKGFYRKYATDSVEKYETGYINLTGGPTHNLYESGSGFTGNMYWPTWYAPDADYITWNDSTTTTVTVTDGLNKGYIAPKEETLAVGYPEWYANSKTLTTTNTDTGTEDQVLVYPVPYSNALSDYYSLPQTSVWDGTLTQTGTGTDTETGGSSGTITDIWTPPAEPGTFALDLTNYFPFCLPFDLYDFLTCLNADPVTPVIEWEIYLPGGDVYPLTLDLSPFDPVAQLLRRLELLLFCVGLAFKTRDLIKG